MWVKIVWGRILLEDCLIFPINFVCRNLVLACRHQKKVLKLFMECVCMLFPGIADKSEFTSAVIHVPLWKNLFFHVCLVLVIIHFIQVTLLNPKSINCWMLWIKLTVAWDFSPPLFRLYSPRFMPPTRSANIHACAYRERYGERSLRKSNLVRVLLHTRAPILLKSSTFVTSHLSRMPPYGFGFGGTLGAVHSRQDTMDCRCLWRGVSCHSRVWRKLNWGWFC